MVSFLHFSQLHAGKGIGSVNIRVKQLIKYWPQAEEYRFGSKPDVLIFQKVYWSPDYYLPETYKAGIKILDICDPDWLQNNYVKRTIDSMDAVVVPTLALKEFVEQLTDKPVKIIKDRFDMELIPKECKKHTGDIKKAVWFGYAHNAGCLEGAVHALEKLKIKLIVVSQDDPQAWHWANDTDNYRKKFYRYYKYNEEKIYEYLQGADVCILPAGNRSIDRFKSDNKTTKARLAGLPVVKNIDELEAMMTDVARNKEAEYYYGKTKKAYDVLNSIKEYEELIDEIRNEQ